jgi:hypothetical protein
VVKYYNAATRNILTLHNYSFLVPLMDNPPKEITIDPGEIIPLHEGKTKDSTQSTDPIIPQKRPANDIDINKPRRTRAIQVNY